MLGSITTFFSSWRFPAVAISILVTYASFLIVLLLWPVPSSLVLDFRVWCFGYDPSTGGLEWAYVWMFLVQPFIMAGLIALTWLQPLREGLATSRAVVFRYGGVGVLVVGGLAVGLLLSNRQIEAAVPSSVSHLRISHGAPPFELTDQRGDAVSLEAMRGRVVLLTAIYTRCSFTCPMIMREVKGVTDKLRAEQRDDLHVVVVTLDPENDSPEVMARLGATHRVEAPLFHLLSGEPAAVGAMLDAYEFSRRKDPATGIMNHGNTALLIDRSGRVAFRLPISEGGTLVLEAAQLLLRERG